MSEPFVPEDFEVPLHLESPQFRLEPLGPQHNQSDFAAWSSSIDHIHSTPGWEESSWPSEMTLDENRGDLEGHADDFANRVGFTYTVLDPDDAGVIGCVYVYPARDESYDVRVLSWVRASRADLDINFFCERSATGSSARGPSSAWTTPRAADERRAAGPSALASCCRPGRGLQR
jgi:hypothetical protein